MKLKLKENPIEWLKFTAVIGTMAGLLWTLGWWKQMHGLSLWYGWVPGIVAALLCAIFPSWFRGFYRTGTTAFFHLGQFMGTILLTLFFIFIMTPMGFVLRLIGNDLLELKLDRTASSYWKDPRKTGGHRKMF